MGNVENAPAWACQVGILEVLLNAGNQEGVLPKLYVAYQGKPSSPLVLEEYHCHNRTYLQ